MPTPKKELELLEVTCLEARKVDDCVELRPRYEQEQRNLVMILTESELRGLLERYYSENTSNWELV